MPDYFQFQYKFHTNNGYLCTQIRVNHKKMKEKNEKKLSFCLVFRFSESSLYVDPDFGNASPKIPFEVEEGPDGLLLLSQEQRFR